MAGALSLIILVILEAACSVTPLRPAGGSDGSGALVLTEIQGANRTSLMDFQGEYPDWFELRNQGESSYDLSGCRVATKPGDGGWTFPALSLAPGEYLVVFASGKDYRDPAWELHTDFSLSAEGERLYLYAADKTLLDWVSFGAMAADQSWIRQADGSLALSGFPSPGSANLSGGLQVAFSLPAGIYSGRSWPNGLSVSLETVDGSGTTGPAGGTIRYTTDGSVPDGSSPVWAGTPVTIPVPAATAAAAGSLADLQASLPAGLVLRARVDNDGRLGPVSSNTYIVHNGDMDDDTRLAVFCLSGDPADLSESGLFDPENLYADSEYPIHVEYFDETRELALEQDAGVGLFGGASRQAAQKSLALYARSVYGKGRFEHDFFGLRNDRGGPITSFDNLVLRNSGNDWDSTMLRDALMTSLLEGTGQDYQAYRPVVLFLNGRYQGFYSLREKVNEDYLASHHPALGNKPIDLLANFWETLAGSDAGFWSLMSWLDNADLADLDQYGQLASQVDVDNFMDYQLANIYFGNTDWPGNNTKYWRPQEGGSWRWIVFDTDFGFGLIENVYHNTLAFALDGSRTEWPNPEPSTRLLRRLMANPGFHDRFYQRLETLLETNFETGRVLDRITEYRAQVEDEILHRHLKRWADAIYTWIDPLDQTGKANQWGWNMDTLSDYARRRPDILRAHVADQLSPQTPVRGNGDGLSAAYYANADWQGGAVRQRDATIDFTCAGDSTPCGELVSDQYSARWTGGLESAFDGPVTFSLSGDDWGCLWLDLNDDGDFDDAGETVVQLDWAGERASGQVELAAGTTYRCRLDFRDWGGDSSLSLSWSKGSLTEVIPQSQFYTVY